MDGGKASSSSGSEEEQDIVVNQSSDVPKGEITGVQVMINEEKMDDSPVVQTEKEENSSGDVEKNMVEAASETPVSSSVPAKNQGNDSQVKTVGDAGETESVDAAAVCCKPVEPLNFDDFNTAKDMEVRNGFISFNSYAKFNEHHHIMFRLQTFILIYVCLVSGYGDGDIKDRTSVSWTEMRRDTAREGCEAVLA